MFSFEKLEVVNMKEMEEISYFPSIPFCPSRPFKIFKRETESGFLQEMRKYACMKNTNHTPQSEDVQEMIKERLLGIIEYLANKKKISQQEEINYIFWYASWENFEKMRKFDCMEDTNRTPQSEDVQEMMEDYDTFYSYKLSPLRSRQDTPQSEVVQRRYVKFIGILKRLIDSDLPERKWSNVLIGANHTRQSEDVWEKNLLDVSWKDVQETRTYACMEDTNHTPQSEDVSIYTNSRISKGYPWFPNYWTDRPQSDDVQETRTYVWWKDALYMSGNVLIDTKLEDVQKMKKFKISVDISRSIIIIHPHELIIIHPHELISSLMNANDIFIEYKISVDPPLSPFRFTPASMFSLLKSKKQYEKTKLIPPPSLSDVPVELIHHIQSLLPVKEAARTSIFSKAWLNAWQTIHKLRFHFKGMRQEMYYNLMLRALLRYQSNLLPIESFDLGLVISNKEIASLVQDWIRHTSSPKACLKELLLDISVSTDSSVTLPPEILSSKTLNSIIVTTDDTSADVKLSFHSNPEMILCVSLRVLDLEYVFISDDVLAKLLSVCSLLEKIRLFCCDGLKTVKVKNLVFLRELKIHVLDIEPIVTIFNVPNLLKVDYFPLFPPIERPPPFNMDSFRSVTQLVIADVLMDYEFFDTIKSKLLCLESLTLRIGDWAQENFVISSVSLKKLDLQIWTSTQFVIEVCAPQLMSCVCECHEPAPIISFAAGNPKHLKVTTV